MSSTKLLFKATLATIVVIVFVYKDISDKFI